MQLLRQGLEVRSIGRRDLTQSPADPCGQAFINREWGLARNENPNQGAFIVDELTELVEEAVLAEFGKIAERGGVLGAMKTGYALAECAGALSPVRIGRPLA